jgi:hypothetical protein
VYNSEITVAANTLKRTGSGTEHPWQNAWL